MGDVMELIAFLAVNLVDHPDDVQVEKKTVSDGDIYRLRVHSDDLGKIIGRNGQTAKAMRTLLEAAGERTRTRIDLEIVDE